jgi:hypothetical protein
MLCPWLLLYDVLMEFFENHNSFGTNKRNSTTTVTQQCNHLHRAKVSAYFLCATQFVNFAKCSRDAQFFFWCISRCVCVWFCAIKGLNC